MDKKFIRIISPFSLVIISALDVSVLAFSAYAIKKLTEHADTYTVIFAVIDVIALLTAVFASKEVFSNGVRFDACEFEFTGLDQNNIFKYADVAEIETQRDTSPSFRKNFVDRYSVLILHLRDESTVSVQLGFTTGRTLNKIKQEIQKRI